METKTEKVTLEQVLTFRELASVVINAHQGKFSRWLNTLTHGLANTKEAVAEFESKNFELLVDLAATDAEGFLRKDQKGGFIFKPENEKTYSAKKKALLKETVDIAPYLYTGTDIPSGVSIATWDHFAPFVLPKMTEEKMEELIAAQEQKEKAKAA